MEANADPLLDPAVLQRLRDGVDDDEDLWRVFVRNFVVLLPSTTERMRSALTTGDASGALSDVLTLKTSSQMVDAVRLAGLAIELELSLRSEASLAEPGRALPTLAVTYLGRITKCGRQTTDLLQKHLG